MSDDLGDPDRLWEFVDSRMVKCRFKGVVQEFLPSRALEEATQKAVITNIILEDKDLQLDPNEASEFIDQVCLKGRRLFINSVYCTMSMSFLRSLMSNGKSDSNIPLSVQECPSDHYRNTILFKNAFLVNLKRFYAPIFHTDSFQTLDVSLPIPIELDESPENVLGKGAFGEVWHIKIHEGQYTFGSAWNKEHGFALRVIRCQASIHQERKDIKAKTTLNHNHLAKCLASFTFSAKYHMIYELAKGNLEELMVSDPHLGPRKQTGLNEAWLIEQLCGLAGALSTIHKLEVSNAHHYSNGGIVRGLDVSQRNFGSIHDVRPENILVFDTCLRLTDFSCIEALDSLSSIDDKRTSYYYMGTPTYRPPECQSGRTSPSHDLWSLGCVYLELITWFLEGYAALETFRSARVGVVKPGGIEDEGFCRTKELGSNIKWELRETVVAKIADLRTKCGERLEGFMEIILTLLRIDPAERPTAIELSNHLSNLKLQPGETKKPDGLPVMSDSGTGDSGYVSAPRDKVDVLDSIGEDNEGDNVSDYTQVSEDDPIKRNKRIIGFAAMIYEDIVSEPLDARALEKVLISFEDMLKLFACRLAYENSEGVADMVVFIRKHRQVITDALRIVNSENEENAKPRQSGGGMNPQEKFAKWTEASLEIPPGNDDPLNEVTDSDWEVSNQGGSDPDDSNQEDLEIENPDLDRYKKIIQQSEAYQWLIAQLRCTMKLSKQIPDIQTEVKETFLAAFPTSRRFSRKTLHETVEAKFELDWDPLAFLQDQYREDLSAVVERVITLTGSAQEAQAATCRGYLTQTWPGAGEFVLHLLQDTLMQGYNKPCRASRSDGIIITMELLTGYTSVHLDGSRGLLAEIVEVLSWLGSSLRTNTNSTEIGFCNAKLETSVASTQGIETKREFRIRFITEQSERDEKNGTCWTKAFRNPAVAIGFPTLLRSERDTGLELPLNVMAALGQAKYVTEFDGKVFIKGFSTVLFPTQQIGDTIFWHLLYNEDRKRMSYRDKRIFVHQNPRIVNIRQADIETSRHVLGWSSLVDNYAGAAEANYDIRRSGFTDHIPGFVLDKFSLSVGKIVTGGASFSIGLKDVSVHLMREGTYADQIEDAYNNYAILFDSEDRRSWLVNGASALLHIVRASLEGSRANELRPKSCFSHQDLHEAHTPYLNESARQVLLSQHNRDLIVSSDKVNLRYECLRKGNGEIERVEKWDETIVRFQDIVNQKWHILEQIMDSQHPEDTPGVHLQLPGRQYIRGFDFTDVATRTRDLLPKLTRLHSDGKGWLDFSKAIRAITLFGRGFGHVFRPSTTSNSLCHNWIEVPKGHDYLVVCVSDVVGISESRGDPTANPMRLLDNIVWHNPAKLFGPCKCTKKIPRKIAWFRKESWFRKETFRNEACDRIQVLLPSSSRLRGINSPGSLESFRHGAIIFGRSNTFPLRWNDTGSPEAEDDIPQSPVLSETQPSDSALGSSMAFSNSQSNTSTDSTSPQTHTCCPAPTLPQLPDNETSGVGSSEFDSPEPLVVYIDPASDCE